MIYRLLENTMIGYLDAYDKDAQKEILASNTFKVVDNYEIYANRGAIITDFDSNGICFEVTINNIKFDWLDSPEECIKNKLIEEVECICETFEDYVKLLKMNEHQFWDIDVKDKTVTFKADGVHDHHTATFTVKDLGDGKFLASTTEPEVEDWIAAYVDCEDGMFDYYPVNDRHYVYLIQAIRADATLCYSVTESLRVITFVTIDADKARDRFNDYIECAINELSDATGEDPEVEEVSDSYTIVSVNDDEEERSFTITWTRQEVI